MTNSDTTSQLCKSIQLVLSGAVQEHQDFVYSQKRKRAREGWVVWAGVLATE